MRTVRTGVDDVGLLATACALATFLACALAGIFAAFLVVGEAVGAAALAPVLLRGRVLLAVFLRAGETAVFFCEAGFATAFFELAFLLTIGFFFAIIFFFATVFLALVFLLMFFFVGVFFVAAFFGVGFCAETLRDAVFFFVFDATALLLTGFRPTVFFLLAGRFTVFFLALDFVAAFAISGSPRMRYETLPSQHVSPVRTGRVSEQGRNINHFYAGSQWRCHRRQILNPADC